MKLKGWRAVWLIANSQKSQSEDAKLVECVAEKKKNSPMESQDENQD